MFLTLRCWLHNFFFAVFSFLSWGKQRHTGFSYLLTAITFHLVKFLVKFEDIWEKFFPQIFYMKMLMSTFDMQNTNIVELFFFSFFQ